MVNKGLGRHHRLLCMHLVRAVDGSKRQHRAQSASWLRQHGKRVPQNYEDAMRVHPGVKGRRWRAANNETLQQPKQRPAPPPKPLKPEHATKTWACVCGETWISSGRNYCWGCGKHISQIWSRWM